MRSAHAAHSQDDRDYIEATSRRSARARASASAPVAERAGALSRAAGAEGRRQRSRGIARGARARVGERAGGGLVAGECAGGLGLAGGIRARVRCTRFQALQTITRVVVMRQCKVGQQSGAGGRAPGELAKAWPPAVLGRARAEAAWCSCVVVA